MKRFSQKLKKFLPKENKDWQKNPLVGNVKF
jgi:hypothetical protein